MGGTGDPALAGDFVCIASEDKSFINTFATRQSILAGVKGGSPPTLGLVQKAGTPQPRIRPVRLELDPIHSLTSDFRILVVAHPGRVCPGAEGDIKMNCCWRGHTRGVSIIGDLIAYEAFNAPHAKIVRSRDSLPYALRQLRADEMQIMAGYSGVASARGLRELLESELQTICHSIILETGASMDESGLKEILLGFVESHHNVILMAQGMGDHLQALEKTFLALHPELKDEFQALIQEERKIGRASVADMHSLLTDIGRAISKLLG